MHYIRTAGVKIHLHTTVGVPTSTTEIFDEGEGHTDISILAFSEGFYYPCEVYPPSYLVDGFSTCLIIAQARSDCAGAAQEKLGQNITLRHQWLSRNSIYRAEMYASVVIK